MDEQKITLEFDNPENLEKYLSELKDKTLNLLENYRLSSNNKTILSKIDLVHEKINELRTKDIDDSMIKKFMVISSLKSQILRSDDE